jgi:hypothetical protein
MISARLVHLIQSNGDEIIDRVAAQIHRETEITHGKSIQEFELQGLGRELLHNLGDWLSPGDGYKLARQCERFGEACYDQAIPLHEALRGLSLLREKMLDVAQENMISNSSVELYAEEELDRRLGRLFDRLAVNMARGFEEAVHKAHDSPHAIH